MGARSWFHPSSIIIHLTSTAGQDNTQEMSAASHVLCLPELLDPILHYVAAIIDQDRIPDRNPARSRKGVLALLQWQCLSSTWRDIIRDSELIQRALFYRSCLQTDLEWAKHSLTATRNPPETPVLNPLTASFLNISHVTEVSILGSGPTYPLVFRIFRRDVRFLSEHPGSWEGMYLSQPPLKRLDWMNCTPSAVNNGTRSFWAMGGLSIERLHQELAKVFSNEATLHEVWLCADAGPGTKR